MQAGFGTDTMNLPNAGRNAGKCCAGEILSVKYSMYTTVVSAANRMSSPTTAIRLFPAYKLEKLLKFEIC